MPKLARDYTYQNAYGYQQQYPRIVTPPRPQLRPVRTVKKKKVNHFQQFCSLIFLAIIGIYVLPFGYNRISKPLLFGSPYKEVKVDYNEILHPTTNYLSNELVLNTRLLVSANTKKPEMSSLYLTEKMPLVEGKLLKLMAQYKTIQPSVFVWDYDTGKYTDIKASETFPTASIIKIPVLIRLFKSIEANQLTIYDEMTLTPYYKAEGSGDLQTRPLGSKYTIDQLAREMITKSDNTATNMLVSAIGGMPDVNSGIRDWGIQSTHIENWLPDIAGSNYTTAKDLATMLYNIDNPGFLNISSRENIIDYMSHVENNRLIQAGLGQGALFVHKTGDIGTMLGDAGIVFTPSSKKYIVVILAKRPYNSPLGKDFIQKASKIFYDSINSGNY